MGRKERAHLLETFWKMRVTNRPCISDWVSKGRGESQSLERTLLLLALKNQTSGKLPRTEPSNKVILIFQMFEMHVNIVCTSGGPNYKYQKMTKLYTAQNRIQRIRNGMNNQNLVPQTQRIRLRRAISVPRNYTVQVQNTPTDFNSFKHSLKKAMNQRLQNEIKLIQSQHGRTELISFDEPLLVNCTTKTLNQRFSLLP